MLVLLALKFYHFLNSLIDRFRITSRQARVHYMDFHCLPSLFYIRTKEKIILKKIIFLLLHCLGSTVYIIKGPSKTSCARRRRVGKTNILPDQINMACCYCTLYKVTLVYATTVAYSSHFLPETHDHE